MNKRGFIGDYGLYVVFIFIIAISLVAAYYVNSTINTAFQADDSLPSASKDMMQGYQDSFIGIWDNFFLLLLIGLLIVLVITAFALRTAPAFALLFIMVMLVFGVVSVHFANSFNDFVTGDAIVSYASDFTQLPWIMANYPKILVIFGFVFIIILFAKTRDSGAVQL